MANKLTSLKLHEVSLVDSPANKHAKVMLFKAASPAAVADGDYPSSIHKRSFSTKEREDAATSGAAMPGGGFPIEDEADLKNAIRAIGRAKDPAKVKAHIRARAKALKLTDLIPETWAKRDSGTATMNFLVSKDAKLAKAWGDGQSVDFDTAQANAEQSEVASGLMQEVNEAVCALGSAIWSIQGDDAVTDKGSAVQESLDQFGEHVKTIVPEGVENALVAGALAQAGYTINPQGGIQLEKGADSMSKAIAKSLGLPDTATEAEILAKMESNAAEAALNASIAKMAANHKAFMDHPKATLPSGGKKAWADMTPEDRAAHMEKNPLPVEKTDTTAELIAKGDAFLGEGGVVLTKKDFGSDAGFAFAKSQSVRLAKAEKDAEESKDEADKTAKTTKAATELSKIGKADEVGGLLHRIGKFDPKLATEVETLLKGANTAIEKGALFSEIGKTVAVTGSAADMIQKGATELLKSEPTLKTIEKARTEFRKRNPEIVKRETEEAAAKKAA